jgi:GWxTD domain-containing protein
VRSRNRPGIASTLQPGIGAGDFEFYADAAGVAPATTGMTLVRVLIQVPARALLDQSRKNRVELRFVAQAYPAAPGLDALSRTPPIAKPALPADSLRANAVGTDAAISWRAFEGVTPSRGRAFRVDADRDRLLNRLRLYDLALRRRITSSRSVENLRKRGLLDRLRHRPSSRWRFLAPFRSQPDSGDCGSALDRPPHPLHYASRLYGLLNDSLRAQHRVQHGNWNLWARVVGRDSALAGFIASGDRWRRDLGFHTSVNTLPAGQYVFQLAGEGDGGMLSTSRSFDVAWSLASFTRARHDLDVEAEIVLSEAEFERYQGQPLGEKERLLEIFWQRNDPTPETAFNEVRAEFERRVAQADISYTEMRRGALTDRGRLYVHFGSPEGIGRCHRTWPAPGRGSARQGGRHLRRLRASESVLNVLERRKGGHAAARASRIRRHRTGTRGGVWRVVAAARRSASTRIVRC